MVGYKSDRKTQRSKASVAKTTILPQKSGVAAEANFLPKFSALPHPNPYYLHPVHLTISTPPTEPMNRQNKYYKKTLHTSRGRPLAIFTFNSKQGN